jgi:hypothetical protein
MTTPDALGALQKAEIEKQRLHHQGGPPSEMMPNVNRSWTWHDQLPRRGNAGLLAVLAVFFMIAAEAIAAGPSNVIGMYGDAVLTQGNTGMSTADTSLPTSHTHTLRITFAYDGPKLEIARVLRVTMRAPATTTTTTHENQAGYWLEVRDGTGALLYQRPIHDPMRRDIESFGDSPGDPMRRHPGTATKGEFEVLVPDLPGARTFRLHGPSAEARAALAPSVSLSEHSFDDLHRFALRAAGRGPQ